MYYFFKFVRYAQYYKEQYGIDIIDRSQPLLISYKNLKGAVDQPQQKICLVPELCRLTGLTQNQRDDHRIMRYVADKTNDVPTDRERKRLDLIRRIKNCDDAYQVRRRISIFPLK